MKNPIPARKLNVRRLLLLTLLAAVCLFASACGKKKTDPLAGLAITEVMPENTAAVQASNGGYYDWFEITNQGSEEVSLKNCFISDDIDILQSFPLSDRRLAPGEAVVFYAVGASGSAKAAAAEAKGEGNSALFVPFKLSRRGEELILSYKDGRILSKLTYENAGENVSVLPDGTVTQQCTPGFENTDAGYLGWLNTLPAPDGLIISEVSNSNENYITHDEYICSDWVELYNASPTAVDLSEYCLSDSAKHLDKCSLPAVQIQPGGCAVIPCDDPVESYKDYVTGFTLGSSAVLYLSKDGQILDAFCVRGIPQGASAGVGTGGKPGYFLQPSPGYPNGEPVYMVCGEPVPSEPEGVYNGITSLSVAFSGGGTVYYTTDGSRPTRSSQVYSGPITVDRSMVIRAVRAEDGKLDSPVRTLSYIVNENHTLPVLSLSVNRSDLFDPETGIYVEGNNFNYFQDWEKNANLTMFDGKETLFNADCGLKMYGGESRQICVKKSFRVGFRSRYGTSHIDGDIFGDGITRHKDFILRAGEDAESTYFRTEALSKLAENMDVLTLHDRFCILYVNGEYWGIYSLLERFTPEYLEQHCGVKAYNATVEKGMIEGDAEETSYVLPIIEWAEEHDLTVQENYDYLAERLDLNSLIDWTIIQAYVRNGDISYNVRYCWSTDGLKITYALFDLDWGFHTAGDNFYAVALPRQFSIFAQKLLKNENFRQMFVDRMAELFRTELRDEHILTVIDEYHDLIAPEVDRDRRRWEYSNHGTYDDWEESVRAMKAFAQDGNIRKDMILSFKEIAGLTPEQESELNASLAE